MMFCEINRIIGFIVINVYDIDIWKMIVFVYLFVKDLVFLIFVWVNIN